jgi:hypothetical protein
MIALVWLQCLGVRFRTALAWSFLLYGIELLLFFPTKVYDVLNVLLAAGMVVEEARRPGPTIAGLRTSSRRVRSP